MSTNYADEMQLKDRIQRLEELYKKYEKITLDELSVEINYVKSGDDFIEKSNSIYIPRVGNSQVVSSISDLKIKHHNYFQVLLESRANNHYVAAFFKSELGRLILRSLMSGVTIPHLNKRDLIRASVVLPSIEVQNEILGTQKKLYNLKQVIEEFDAELALNPNPPNAILAQVDSMLDIVGRLTDIDKVRRTVTQGESKTIEFKETLSLDVRKGTRESYIELGVLKTIVAFLNTEGGTLLVGINDNRCTTGLNHELEQFHKKNMDTFLLHFKNLIKAKIGEEFYPFIEYKQVFIDDQYILMVECQKSSKPCFLNAQEFYVRTNPATDKLEGPKLIAYISNHFGSK